MYAEIAADPNQRETYLAVHISDVHLDNLYTPGTIANCEGYLCCHESDGYAKKEGEIPAGYWGAYLCDIPTRTFTTMLDFIKQEVKPDMMIMTGDYSSHYEGYNDIQEVTEYVIQVTELIKAAFVDTDITVLPI
jgi:sphingomyelin phosphodiesterase